MMRQLCSSLTFLKVIHAGKKKKLARDTTGTRARAPSSLVKGGKKLQGTRRKEYTL